MADDTAPDQGHTTIHTGGGDAVAGGKHIHGPEVRGNYTGVDQSLNVTINVSGDRLQELLAKLSSLLAQPGAEVRAGAVTADGQTVDVPPELADALRQFVADVPGPTQAERERQYLVNLCVNPEFHQWQQRYVALSGGYRTVPELTPNYSTILVRGEGPQRQIERVPLSDIREALDAHAAFILLAQPGAGKTTVLQRIGLDKAQRCMAGAPDALLPLFVRLAAQGETESPHDFLARAWQAAMPGDSPAAELHDALKTGRLCLLVDALNESRREHYNARMEAWRDFAKALPAGNRLVFTCRKLDYNGELMVQQVEIDPLDEAQIQDFAVRYLGETEGQAFWSALKAQHGDLLELAQVPYYLHLLVDVYAAQHELPKRRAGLFEQFTRELFRREQGKNHPVAWIDPAAQHLALSELAYAMQALGTGTQVEQAWACEMLPAQVTLPDGSEIAAPPADVLALARAASLLAGSGDGKVKFTHHLTQEYFAAEELLRRLAAGEDLAGLWRVPSGVREMPKAVRGEWDPLPGPPTTGWEETTILAAGLYHAIFDAVQPVNPALAARCLLEGSGDGDAARVAQSRKALLARLGSVAIHVRSRIEAGLLLGRLGDPRFPVEEIGGVKVILPPMVAIAGGAATIGSGFWQKLRERRDNETPRHSVPLAGYAISRYPVTNAEYGLFMVAGGYDEDRYWTVGGRHWRRGEPVPGEKDPADWWIDTWRRFKADPAEIDRLVASGVMTRRDADNLWRILITWDEAQVVAQVREWYPQGQVVSEPRYWRDATFANPSQPVVGVCWYEATAYAAWLAAVTGQPFRLPTEPEWEWAARRGGRTYPWGSNWDASRLNSLEGDDRVMATTPVGAYPHGATPDGIHDLAGNVWEWTATRVVAYPYDANANLEDSDGTGLRINRGGGWAANRKMVRCAYRYGFDPRYWGNHGGFRLARILS